jgi:small subunit ribosomal protein S20
MANHFSALKRARQTEKRTARNRGAKSALRGSIRTTREALTGGDANSARQQLQMTAADIDRAVSKGVLHKNTAARYKSRLAARLNKAGQK